MIYRLQVRLVVSLMIAIGILVSGWLWLRSRYRVHDRQEEQLHIPLPSDIPAKPITVPLDDKSYHEHKGVSLVQEPVPTEVIPPEFSTPTVDINSLETQQKEEQEESVTPSVDINSHDIQQEVGQEENKVQVLQENISYAYCVRCRQKRRIENAQRITTKNGRAALSGLCAECNTRLFRFISSKD